jgi:SAM-dependent methyltransferase
MTADAHMAAEFYASATGAVASRLLRERLSLMWPELRGDAVLGIGYAVPYLRLWRDHAARCIALTPAQLGSARWPAGAPNLSCTAEEDTLPFADLTFDRILLVHGLETAENARRLLREVWRVLKDDGRLIIVAPNRSGMWAYWDNTPFGHGQPYSTGQLGRLLAAGLFRVERRDAALWLPPAGIAALLRSAALFENGGRRFMPAFAGVTLTEAVKDVYAAMPIHAVHRRMVFAEAA